MKVMVIPIAIGALRTITKVLDKRDENQRMSRDCPNYSINEISQNTEKSSGDLVSLELQ